MQFIQAIYKSVSARRRSCCGHGYPLDFSGRVTGGKALFVGAVGGVGW